MNNRENKIEKWTKETAMDTSVHNKIPPSYPNEAMVKIFVSGYFSLNTDNFSVILFRICQL